MLQIAGARCVLKICPWKEDRNTVGVLKRRATKPRSKDQFSNCFLNRTASLSNVCGVLMPRVVGLPGNGFGPLGKRIAKIGKIRVLLILVALGFPVREDDSVSNGIMRIAILNVVQP